MAPKASAKPMASAKASAKPMTSMAPKASAKASSAFQKEEEKDKNEKKQKMPGANMKAKKEKKHQKEEKDKNEKKQKMQGANMKAKKEKKQEKKKEGNEQQTLVQIQTLIKENEVDFHLPDPDPNPERLRPALLTPWGTTDDEPPIGESRFGKNRVTFSQSRVSLGDLGCSKCNGGTFPSGSGCTTCRRKLGWVPADATKKHWVPAGLIADDDKHW